jgi:hypothetical protein
MVLVAAIPAARCKGDMHMKRMIAVAALLAATLPTLASETCTEVPQEKWLKPEQVQARLEAQGYDVRRVKREGNCYEVKALRGGKRVEAKVDPSDAKVVRERVKEAS